MATITDLSSASAPVNSLGGGRGIGSSSPTHSSFDYENMFARGDFLSWMNRGLFPAYYEQTRQDFLTEKDMNYNAEQARLGRDFLSVEAQKDRDFQERLSNTAYQRAVEDMRKAGINPIVAFSQGASSASTPSGSSLSSAPTGHSASKYSRYESRKHDFLMTLLKIGAGLLLFGK